MSDQTYKVLFIDRNNADNSLFGEALLNYWGKGKFEGMSAGVQPAESVSENVTDLLDRLKIPREGLHPKGLEDLHRDQDGNTDFVFFLDDELAADPQLKQWKGDPLTAVRHIPDPQRAEGSEAEVVQAYRNAFHALESWIKIFVNLPFESLDRLKLQQRLNEISSP